MRLIDADALDMYECLRSYYGDAWRDAQKAIDDAPTVDPVKHGHWVDEGEKFLPIYCSCCGFGKKHEDQRSYTYCPNCGAKMDEVADDES